MSNFFRLFGVYTDGLAARRSTSQTRAARSCTSTNWSRASGEGFNLSDHSIEYPRLTESAFSAEMPEDKVSTLQSNEHLNVEADGKVTTQ